MVMELMQNSILLLEMERFSLLQSKMLVEGILYLHLSRIQEELLHKLFKKQKTIERKGQGSAAVSEFNFNETRSKCRRFFDILRY